MPQGKRGQGSAERQGKRSSRTEAKVIPATPAKRRAAEATAKPVAKVKVAKAAAKPSAAAKTVVKAAAKRVAAKAVVTPAKKRKKTDPVEHTPADPIVGAVAEPVLEHWIADADFAPVTPAWLIEPVEEAAAEAPVEERPVEAAADWFASPLVKPVSESGIEIAKPVVERVAEPVVEAAVELAAEPVEAEETPRSAVGQWVSDSISKPFTERRKSFKSLLERRLMDPSAKERRSPDSLANEPRLANPAPTARVAVGPKLKETVAADPAAAEQSVTERRMRQRRANRGGENIETEIRGHEQQLRLNETAVWMRKGGAVLIGLNVLTVIAVLLLGRVHVSQLKEMQRATAASGDAAYAACLGTQTARNMLLELKAERTAPRDLPAGTPPPALAPTRAQAVPAAQAAQIAFDVEKTTSVNPHIPVLFHFAVHNTGASSAVNLRVWGAVKVLDAGEQPKFEYGEASLKKASLSPNDPAEKVITYTEDSGNVVPLTDAEFQRVSSGAAYVVAYGRAVYQDASGARHWAVFCRNLTEPAGGKRSSKCSAYNGAGDSEVTEKPAEAQKIAEAPAATVSPRLSQSAAVSLPEIACEVPKERKY
jgi:hypothetical protein